MFGGLLALVAAITFALNNAAFRRGALTGTVAQGMAISLLLGVALFVAAVSASGSWAVLARFPMRSVGLLCAAGILHFAWGRYCNFRATKAMGANLVAPLQQVSIIVTLVLAVLVLGEKLTPLRILGILLVVLGPMVSVGARKASAGPTVAKPAKFSPNYAEGCTFALLSATGYGTSPILVRDVLDGAGVAESLAAGLIAYIAATAVMALVLARPALRANVMSVDAVSGKWFSMSGVLVCVSQMTSYLALAVAPVSVVMPIQRLSLVFRVFANSALNREHEIVGGRIWFATIVGLAGAFALSASTDFVLSWLSLPAGLDKAARWQWP